MKAIDNLKQKGYLIDSAYHDANLQWCEVMELMVQYANEKNKELIEALDSIQDVLCNHLGDDTEETPLIQKALNAIRNTPR